MQPGQGVSALDRLLTFAHWAWFFEPHLTLVYILVADEPRFVRAARQMARRLRPRLRDLHRSADRAAVVGGRARLHRRRAGASPDARGRRGGLGPRLAEALQLGRRQPVGRDALAALRRLGARRDPAQRVGPAGRRRRLDLRRRPRPRPRLPRRALRRRPARRTGAGRRRPPRRAARRTARARGQPRRAEAGGDRRVARRCQTGARLASARTGRMGITCRISGRAIARIRSPGRTGRSRTGGPAVRRRRTRTRSRRSSRTRGRCC